MELTEKFWKYASAVNKVDSIENIFIEWAGKERISINEFNSIYIKVGSQLKDMFDKSNNNQKTALRIESDGSVSGTPEEINQWMLQQKQEKNAPQNIPQESDFNNEISNEDKSENNIENTSENIAQQSTENEQNVGQDLNKTSISPEPNSSIQEEPQEKVNEEIFPLLNIIGS